MVILVEKDAFGAGDSMDIERDCVVSSDLRLTEPTENTDEGEVLMLQEDDIPGASLNGKDPSETELDIVSGILANFGIKD